MDEYDVYQSLGEWLVEEKKCQSNDYFLGYTTEPLIWDKCGEKVRKPDIVAAQYEPRGTESETFDFHFHVIEVKTGIVPEQIQNLIGKIETLKQFLTSAILAADSVSYYVAIPTIDVPPNLRSWAEQEGVGIIGLETNEGRVTAIREVTDPSRQQFKVKRSEFLSNKDQDSVGKFIEAIENTSVLDKVMVPREFFEQEIRPEQERYYQETNRNRFLSYIENEASRISASELLKYFDKTNGTTVNPPSSGIKTGKVNLEILNPDNEKVLTFIPQCDNFKIEDSNDKILFRVLSEDEIECFDVNVVDFSSLKSYLRSLAC